MKNSTTILLILQILLTKIFNHITLGSTDLELEKLLYIKRKRSKNIYLWSSGWYICIKLCRK